LYLDLINGEKAGTQQKGNALTIKRPAKPLDKYNPVVNVFSLSVSGNK
jgi:hypothetical protein